jgi:hypothetical protein
MSCIKRTPADIAFSRCVRYRAGYQCERCGAQHTESSMGLHCSHVHGRRSWSVRFHPENAFALCYGCHSYMGSNPHEHEAFAISKIGPGRYELLLELKRDTRLGKVYRQTGGKGEIAKHYRNELKRMESTKEPDFDAWY